MNKIFTFTMKKIAGVVICVSLAMGAMNAYAAGGVEGDLQSPFSGGSWVVDFDHDSDSSTAAVTQYWLETSEGVWQLTDINGVIITGPNAEQIDQARINAIRGVDDNGNAVAPAADQAQFSSTTYDAGIKADYYTQADVDAEQNTEIAALESDVVQNTTDIAANTAAIGTASVLATAADVTAALLLDPSSTLAIGDVIEVATGLTADVETNAADIANIVAGVLNGTDGTDGIDGQDGAKGDKGDTGDTGATGSQGATGSTGATGAQGVAGTNGTDGTNGTNGTNGTDGATGAQGVAGTNGTDGTNGTNGTNGTDGTNGTNGATGATGADGDDFDGDARLTSVEDSLGSASTSVTSFVSGGFTYVQNEDGTWFNGTSNVSEASLIANDGVTQAEIDGATTVTVNATGLTADVEANTGAISAVVLGLSQEVLDRTAADNLLSGRITTLETTALTVSLSGSVLTVTGVNGISASQDLTAIDTFASISGSVITFADTSTLDLDSIAGSTGSIATQADVDAGDASAVGDRFGQFGYLGDLQDQIDSLTVAAGGSSTTNATNIATNVTDIAANLAAILSNDSDIAANLAAILSNDSDIAANLAAILSNDSDIAANLAAILSNDSDIAANLAAILSNDSDIAANLAAILSNDSDIAANLAAILSNDSDIAANLAALDVLNGSGLGSVEADIAAAILAAATSQSTVDGTQNADILANTAAIGTASSSVTSFVSGGFTYVQNEDGTWFNGTSNVSEASLISNDGVTQAEIDGATTVTVNATGLTADVEANADAIDAETDRVGSIATSSTPEVPFVGGLLILDPVNGSDRRYDEIREGVWVQSGGVNHGGNNGIEVSESHIQGVMTYFVDHSQYFTFDSGTEFVAATSGVLTGTGELGVVADAINAETAARIAADNELQTSIEAIAADLVSEGARLDQAILDGDAATLVTATNRIADLKALLLIDINANANAIAANAAAITAEQTARIMADAVIQADVDANEAAQVIKNASLDAADAVEKAARMAADAVLAADLVSETMARIAADTVHDIQLAVHEGRLNDIDVILADHESRISALEALHVVDKSFSKVIDGPNGTKIVMHFDADGTMRGKARTLTFLENPVVHGEMDILWNDKGQAVNAITGLRVDAATGLPMADKVEAEVKVEAPYVAAELASDVRFGASVDADVEVEAKVAAPVVSQSFTDAEIAKFKSMINMMPVVELVAEETPVAKAAVVEAIVEDNSAELSAMRSTAIDSKPAANLDGGRNSAVKVSAPAAIEEVATESVDLKEIITSFFGW